jgi:hypothetical protein
MSFCFSYTSSAVRFTLSLPSRLAVEGNAIPCPSGDQERVKLQQVIKTPGPLQCQLVRGWLPEPSAFMIHTFAIADWPWEPTHPEFTASLPSSARFEK